MQRVGFVVLPGFQLMSVGALCVFEVANKEMGEAVYDVHLVSETGGPSAARSVSASQRSRSTIRASAH
jgi:transcriptional regulator GlxA family with amidase domain